MTRVRKGIRLQSADVMRDAARAYVRSRRGAILSLALGAVIAIATWPFAGEMQWGPGIDPSFIAGYHVAVQRGFHFGSELAFTYGPLGFLAFPVPFLGWTSVIALAFAGLLHWAFSTVLLSLARGAFPLWAALILGYLGARPSAWLGVPEIMVVLALVVSVWLLGNRGALGQPELVVLACGAFAGLSLLGKFNTGVVIAGIVALTASQLTPSWWRGVLLAALATASSAVGIWLLMGQDLADIPPFVRLALDAAVGYSSAMGLDAGPTYQGLLGVALVTLVALAGLAWRVSRRWPWSARLVLVLIGLGVAFATYKGAFVRWHYLLWFASAVPVAFAFIWDRRMRIAAAAMVSLLLVVFLIASGVTPGRFLDPFPQVASALDELGTASSPSLRSAAVVRAREAMQDGYRLNPAFLGRIRPYTVHIDPWEAGVAFAYPDLKWRPLPVFQTYGAYTQALDEANADFFASAAAPDRIIRMPPIAIDHRFPWFEQPAATVQMVCRYEQIKGFPLFGRIPNRCGAAEPIGSIRVSLGQTVDVPVDVRPNRMILARIHGVGSSIPERLVAFAWKADEWSITLNGANVYRLVPGTAPGPHILSIPPTVEWAPPFDYPTPSRTLSINARDGGRSSGDLLTIDFFSMAVAAA